MKKINFLVALLICCASSLTAQTTQEPLSSPGEMLLVPESNIEDEVLPQESLQTFKEESIGIFFMPIPLNIDKISFTTNGTTTELQGADDLFNTGIGVAINADFEKSGFGIGANGYFAVIGGDNLRAYDGFVALKYDIPLGDRAETDFELSPLLGIGSMGFQETVNDLYLGSSFYFSGGARITWRVANKLFLGADFQTVPSFFNPEQLLGVEDTVDEVEIDFKFFAQLNFSLRYSL